LLWQPVHVALITCLSRWQQVLFVDRSLVALLWPLVDSLTTVRNVVVMDDGAGAVPDDPRILM
jgi:hypothetical protein